METVAKRLGIPIEKVLTNLRAWQHFGGLYSDCTQWCGQGRQGQERRHYRLRWLWGWIVVGRRRHSLGRVGITCPTDDASNRELDLQQRRCMPPSDLMELSSFK